MNIIFELNHPKHYYQFRKLIELLKHDGNNILILARDKDVLLRILDEEKQDYIVFGKHGKSIAKKLFILPKLIISYFKIIKRFKADIILSKASLLGAIINPFHKAKHIITPDSEVVWLTNNVVVRLSDVIITPNNFSLEYGKKHKHINGFFEESYLSPNVFNPDINLLEEYKISQPFFILRFVSWNANHDVGNWGFTDDQKIKLFELLSKHGQVIISAERNILPNQLLENQITIPPSKIHHFIHFANMYIGDSQSMATEASLLGTPSYRYNSFVGENDMTNFIVLENKHQMLRNFNSFNELYNQIIKDLGDRTLKSGMILKREKYFSNKDDINEQLMKVILDNKKQT